MSTFFIILSSLIIVVTGYSGISLVLFQAPYHLKITSLIIIIVITIFILLNLETSSIWDSSQPEAWSSIRYLQIFLNTLFFFIIASAICYFLTGHLLNLDTFLNSITFIQKILIVSVSICLNASLIILSYLRN